MESWTVDDHWKPYPELITRDGKPYHIEDSRGMPGLPTIGMTDKVGRVLWVPFDAAGRVVSQHELAHVRWTPAVVDVKRLGVPVPFLRAVEDARVNIGLED